MDLMVSIHKSFLGCLLNDPDTDTQDGVRLSTKLKRLKKEILKEELQVLILTQWTGSES